MTPDEAAYIITRLVRKFNTRCVVRRRVRSRYAARIQRWWCYWRSVTPCTWRRTQRQLVSDWLRHEAALTVQRVFRGFVARRSRPLREARAVAAVLQRVGRGFVARWWTGSLLVNTGVSPTRSAASGLSPSDPGSKPSASIRRSSQSQVLVPVGYRAAADANEFVLRLRGVKQRARDSAARQIQAWWRNTSAALMQQVHERTLQRLLFLNEQAINVQRWWRRCLKKRAARNAKRRQGAGQHPGSPQHGAQQATQSPSRDDVEQALVVRHSVLAAERGAHRRGVHDQLLSIWSDVTVGRGAAGSGQGKLPPIGTPSPAPGGSAQRSRGGGATRGNRSSTAPRDESSSGSRRTPASTYVSRFNPETPVGRYAAYGNNGRQIWNSATEIKTPKWYEGERDVSQYKRGTVPRRRL